MPSTISKRSISSTGVDSRKSKPVVQGRSWRWKNLANGKTVDLNADILLPRDAVEALKSAGILVRLSLRKIGEGKVADALLKKLGAKRLTAKDRRIFRKHLST